MKRRLIAIPNDAVSEIRIQFPDTTELRITYQNFGGASPEGQAGRVFMEFDRSRVLKTVYKTRDPVSVQAQRVEFNL